MWVRVAGGNMWHCSTVTDFRQQQFGFVYFKQRDTCIDKLNELLEYAKSIAPNNVTINSVKVVIDNILVNYTINGHDQSMVVFVGGLNELSNLNCGIQRFKELKAKIAELQTELQLNDKMSAKCIELFFPKKPISVQDFTI